MLADAAVDGSLDIDDVTAGAALQLSPEFDRLY